MFRNHPLNILYSAHGLFMLASIMVTSLFAIFAEQVEASIIVIGYLGSTFFTAKAVGTLLMRVYGDSLSSQKKILVYGYVLKAIGWFTLIFVTHLNVLFAVQIILGFSDGIQSPAFRAIVAKNLDNGHEVSEYASWEIVLAVTGVVGATASGFIVGTLGFSTLFLIISSFALVSAVVIALTQIPE
jgi:predicted MFS family arabinose efflux permease